MRFIKNQLIVTKHEVQSNILLCPNCQEELLGVVCSSCKKTINVKAINYVYSDTTGVPAELVTNLVEFLRKNNYPDYATTLAGSLVDYEKTKNIKHEHIRAYELMGKVVKKARSSTNENVKRLGNKVATIKYLFGQRMTKSST